jgi:hypothetical protein
MTTLRQLAEAWIQWHCETDDLRFEGGSSNTNKVMRAYVEAANPSAILDLLDTIDAQRKLLERAQAVLSASYGDAYDEALETAVWKDITAHLEATK